MEKKNIPELRFKGFEDEWELKTLGELAIFNPKSTLPRKFKYVDLESVLGTEMVGYTIHSKKSAPSRAQRLATYGDVFFQTVRPYQRNNLLFEIKENDYVFSTGYAQLRPIMSGSFLFALIQKDSFVQKVLDECTGTSFPAISSRSLSNISVNYSDNLFEQEKIGLLFKNIDKKLELEKEKHKKLKDFKKSMLEDMFPKEGESIPKLRFDGFEGNWINNKVKGLLSYEQPGNYIVASDKYKSSGIPVLTANKSFILGYTDENNIYNKGECIIFDDFTMDLKFVDFPFMVKSSAIKILTSISVDLYFMYILLSSLELEAESHKRHYISFIQELELLIPSLEEQEKIGNFFKNLDQKIEASEEKIKKIEDFKKSLMEKMFV